jgi:hypothetical protein
VALSALLDVGDTIVPVAHVRRQDEGPIKEILGPFPNIDTSRITSHADQGDVIELRYIEHNRRVERQMCFMNPIVPADVDEVLDADAFVCVPITDYEVGQPTQRGGRGAGCAWPDGDADPQRRAPSEGVG